MIDSAILTQIHDTGCANLARAQFVREMITQYPNFITENLDTRRHAGCFGGITLLSPNACTVLTCLPGGVA